MELEVNNFSKYGLLTSYFDVTHNSLEKMRDGLENSQDERIRNLAEKESKTNIFETLNEIRTSDLEYLTKEEAEIEHYDNQITELGELSKLFYSSFVMMWYSMIESYMWDLCICLDLKKETERNEGIVKTKDLLLRQKKYEIDPHDWTELNGIRLLRNKLIHSGPNLSIPKKKSTKDTELLKYLTNHNLYNNCDKSTIELNSDYCKHLIQFGEKSMKKLYQDLYPPQVSRLVPFGI
jgi:hypothetical protein